MASISFHGMRAGVLSTIGRTGWCGSGAVVVRGAGHQVAGRRVVRSPPCRVTEHAVGLVDQRHRLGVGPAAVGVMAPGQATVGVADLRRRGVGRSPSVS